METFIVRELRTTIGDTNVITVPALIMREGAEIHDFNKLVGDGKVILEEGAVVSDFCLLKTTMRTSWGLMSSSAPEEMCDIRCGDILIGKNAYIDSHTIIEPGVKIGANTYVAAHSYISGDVEPDKFVRFKAKRIEHARTIKPRK